MPEDVFLNPYEVMKVMGGVAPASTVADFGCGHGFFSIPFAKEVGEEGAVFAIDVQEEALSYLAARASRLGLPHIRALRRDLEQERGSTLPDQSCDVVLVANLLFQTSDKGAIVREAARVLKPGGRLVVIDWQPGSVDGGPPEEQRVSVRRVKEMAAPLALQLRAEFPAGKYHWGLVFEKPASA